MKHRDCGAEKQAIKGALLPAARSTNPTAATAASGRPPAVGEAAAARARALALAARVARVPRRAPVAALARKARHALALHAEARRGRADAGRQRARRVAPLRARGLFGAPSKIIGLSIRFLRADPFPRQCTGSTEKPHMRIRYKGR